MIMMQLALALAALSVAKATSKQTVRGRFHATASNAFEVRGSEKDGSSSALPDAMASIVLLYNKRYFDARGIITVVTPRDVPAQGGVLFLSRHDDKRHFWKRGRPLYAEYILQSRGLLQAMLDRCASFPTQDYVVVCGKSDYAPRANIRVPQNVARLYANNVANHGADDSVHFFPMGRDWRAFRSGEIPSVQQTVLQGTERSILCYGAFNTTSCYYPHDPECSRRVFGRVLQDKPWVTWQVERLDRPAFFATLERCKFVLCPRGNGIDTFRFYDAMYAGAIPIVVGEPYHVAFEHVPILFVESPQHLDALTEGFLLAEYERLAPMRRAYYAVLDFDTWVAEFHHVLQSKARRRQIVHPPMARATLIPPAEVTHVSTHR